MTDFDHLVIDFLVTIIDFSSSVCISALSKPGAIKQPNHRRNSKRMAGHFITIRNNNS